MYQSRSQGFTLIELLVVIAIIGILSSVVLASLSTARNKAKDASVQESMSGMRTAAELAYSTLGNKYTSSTVSTCDTTTAGQIFSDTTSNMKNLILGVTSGGATLDCGATSSAWSVAATLPSGTWFCVDSTGAAKSTQGTGSTAYTGLTGSANAAHTSAGAVTCN